MLEMFKKAAQKIFSGDASPSEGDIVQGLQNTLDQAAEDNRKILELAKRTKVQADEMAQHMQELQGMARGSDNIGFLPGSADEKLANLKQQVAQGRREIFAQNGGVVSVETEKPFTAMRPLKFKSSATGVTA